MSPLTRVVSSEEVAAYEGMVFKGASKFATDRDDRNSSTIMVEFDDLAQEGRIAVWKSLQRGIWPSTAFVENAMRDWVRKCARFGMGGYVELSSVEEELSRLTTDLD